LASLPKESAVETDPELTNDDIDDTDDTPNIKALRAAAEDGKRAREEAAAARRELLFVKAGVDTESKLGKLLFKTYEGDDLEALKQEWTELSGDVTAPKPDPGPTGSEQAVDNVRDQLRNAPPGGAEPAQVDAYDLSFKTYYDDLAKGLPSDQARENAVSVLLEQFMSGNTSVQFDPADWSRQQQLAGDGQ
jgi:hypothetical protein